MRRVSRTFVSQKGRVKRIWTCPSRCPPSPPRLALTNEKYKMTSRSSRISVTFFLLQLPVSKLLWIRIRSSPSAVSKVFRKPRLFCSVFKSCNVCDSRLSRPWRTLQHRSSRKRKQMRGKSKFCVLRQACCCLWCVVSLWFAWNGKYKNIIDWYHTRQPSVNRWRQKYFEKRKAKEGKTTKTTIQKLTRQEFQGLGHTKKSKFLFPFNVLHVCC